MSTAQLSEFGQEQQEDYRPLSAPAVAALLLGLAAPLAFWHPVLWLVPLVAAACGAWALRGIRLANPPLAGRGAATVGLLLGLLLLAAAPSRELTRQWLLRSQARQLADQWFEYLRNGEPHKAYQLSVEPATRVLAEDAVWDFYRYSSDNKRNLNTFVSMEPVRTLLTLRDLATVRHYDTEEQARLLHGDRLVDVYAVTFPHMDQTKTFFVQIECLYYYDRLNQVTGWKIKNTRGPYRPKKWKGP